MTLRKVAVVVGYSIGALVLVLVIALGALLADVGDVQRHVTRSAMETILHRPVQIDGPVALDISMIPTLSAERIRIENPKWTGEDDFARVGRFSVALSLTHLLDGILLLPAVQFDDVSLKLARDSQGRRNWEIEPDAADETGDGTGVVPLIKDLSIKNLVVEYTNARDNRTNSFVLASLEKREKEDRSLQTFSANGLLDGEPIEFRGTFTSIAETLEAKKAITASVEAKFPNLHAAIRGLIDPFDAARALDLDADIVVSDLQQALQRWTSATIPKGSAKLTTHIFGDVNGPALSDLRIDVALANGGGAKVRGKIGDTGKWGGMDLALSAELSGQQQWLKQYADILSSISAAVFSARASGSLSDLLLKDIELRLVGQASDLLDVGGSAIFDLADDTGIFTDANLSVKLGIAKTAIYTNLLDLELDELGPLTVQTGLALKRQSLHVRKLIAQSRRFGEVALKMNGRVASRLVPASLNPDLNVEVSIKDSALALSNLGIKVPKIGPMKANGHVTGSKGRYTLDALHVDIGKAPGPSLTGRDGVLTATFGPRFEIDKLRMAVSAQIPNSRPFFDLYGIDLPELGPVAITSRVREEGKGLRFERFDLTSGSDKTVALRATGSGDLSLVPSEKLHNLELALDLRASRSARVWKLFGVNLPELGPAELKASLHGGPEQYGVKKIRARIGDRGALTVVANGDIGTVQPGLRTTAASAVKIRVSAHAPKTKNVASLFGIDVPNLGPLNAHGNLADREGRIALNDAHLTVGERKHPLLRLDGRINDVLTLRGFAFRAGVDALPAGFLDLDSKEALGRVRGSAALTDEDGSLGLERIDVKTVKGAPFSAKITGELDDLTELDELRIGFELDVPDARSLAASIGKKFPPIAPIAFRGTVSGRNEYANARGDFTAGKTKLSGDFGISFRGERPRFDGRLSSKLVHLSDFGLTVAPVLAGKAPQSEAPLPTKRWVFGTDPLPLDVLGSLDLDLALSIDAIKGNVIDFDKLAARILLENGALNIRPARFTFVGGEIDAELRIDAKTAPPKLELKASTKDLNLESILNTPSSQVPIGGDLDMRASLSARGRSARSIAETLNGDLILAISRGRMHTRYFGLTAMSPIAWAISKEARSGYSPIDCFMINFRAHEGKVETNGLTLITPNVVLTGGGTIDLHNETIDFSFQPRARQRHLVDRALPYALRGTLASPELDISLARESTRALGRIITSPINTLGGLLPIVRDNGDDANNPCVKQ